MAIDSDIRDQAYQFFIQEAPELLQVIETELLTLRQERSTAKVHNMMRAAHSIKGGAASVGLDTLKTLAHSVEDIFKGLYSEELEIDTEIESLLLQAYDCLRLPLMEQITTGQFNSDQAMAAAEPVFAQIEERLGDFLRGAANLPSSVELGVDIALSIFEVDVAQGLDHLATVLAAPQGKEVAGELRAQAEVFAGLAELLNLPGFGAIAQTALAALDAHPAQALQITQLALADFQAARQAVIAGDRTQGGAPSTALVELANRCEEKRIQKSGVRSQESEVRSQESEVRSQESGVRSEVEKNSEFRIGQDYPSPDSWLLAPGSSSSDSCLLTPEFFGADTPKPEDITAIPSLDDVFGDFFLTTEPTALDLSSPIPVTPIELSPQELHPDLVETIDEQDNIPELVQQQLNAELLEQVFASPVTEEEEHKLFPSLDDVFGDFNLTTEPAAVDPSPPIVAQPQELHSDRVKTVNTQESIQELLQSVEQTFSSLPPIEEIATATDNSAITPSPHHPITPSPHLPISPVPAPAKKPTAPQKREATAIPTGSTPGLSVRVDLERLERMNNLVGELAINRNGLSLQNEQLQKTVQELLHRFGKFQEMGRQLRDLSDRMLVAPERYRQGRWGDRQSGVGVPPANRETDFDSLEMDSYGELHSLLQGTLEEIVQLEETVGDVVHLAGHSSQTLEQQRQMLGYLRDDLMWARMLPLGEVLNRFPRILRDLSTSYEKPVELKLNGTGVLVDKAALEKLYDPLLHLLRNAFDHGIEMPEVRRQQGKRPQGQIEIRAHHQGSQTIIEVRDDGRGINLERIRSKAIDMGLSSPEQLATASTSEILELLFEPGFSTASQVSELSGRGVGLDVVRSQLRSLKGTVTVSFEPGIGTTFTLRIPLTLTIAKLLICFVGSTAFALPSDSIAEILIPKPGQIKQSGGQRFLYWENQIIPAYHLSELVHYACPLPEAFPSQVLVAVPSPEDWAPPMLLLEQDRQILALEIDRLVTEQELVIKPLGAAIASPSYIYGCTILGDGNLIPVIDGAALLNQVMSPNKTAHNAFTKAEKPASAVNEDSSITADASFDGSRATPPPRSPAQTVKASTVLVVDDSITLRQTIALTLEKAGYRVLQARDGREAIDQLQQNSTVQLVVCDVEMPNMNGFEFLSHRRQDSVLSKIPVVMLTSRSSDKHRQLAMHLGAKAYFTKPYIEQEFLAELKTIIKQNAPVGVPALAHSL